MPKKSKKRGKPASKPRVKVAVAATSGTAPVRGNAEQCFDPPVKSDADDNKYRLIKLANGLMAMLISSPGNDYSGVNYFPMEGKAKIYDDHCTCGCDASGWFKRMMNKKRNTTKEAHFELCVNAGSYNDPHQLPGVSRLLSKLILQRSKKYPHKGEDFRSWLCEREGGSAIIDEGERTVYSMEFEVKHMNEALDRFSQGLISPLLAPADVTSVRSEVQRNDEYNRSDYSLTEAGKQNLFNNLLVSEHPACVYGSTYLKGLNLIDNDKVTKEVIKFREQHYSAHRMTIVLKAEVPLERLEKCVREYFAKVPNNGLPFLEFGSHNFMNSFDESKYPKIYKLKRPTRGDLNDGMSLNMQETSDSSLSKIELTWSMPPSQWLYRTKPDRYLAWLITHQGKGSLISYLRRKNMCTLINSGIGDKEYGDNSLYTLFSVSLTLTDEGRKDYRKVLDAVFAYINFLGRKGPQPEIYDEIRQIEDSLFRYIGDSDEFNIYDDTKKLSVHMHLFSPADYLTGKRLLFEYDLVSITTYMQLMSPERANIILYEKGTKVTHSEFPSDKIPDEWLQSWINAEPDEFPFELPQPNAFRADDFTLITVDGKTPRKPVKIHSDDLSEIWYGIGTKFRSPVCYVNIFFIIPHSMSTPENAAMTDMLVKFLRRVTDEELYPARIAGMTVKFGRPSDEGIELLVTGFSQKLPKLMELLAKLIGNCSKLLTSDIFVAAKKKVLTRYENRILDGHEVETLAEDLRLSILKAVHWTRMEKYEALADLKFPQFRRFVKQFHDHVYVKCLVQGNMSVDDAKANIQKFLKISKCGSLAPEKRPKLQMHEIPTGCHTCRVPSFTPRSDVITVKNYYQCAGYSTRAIVMIDLLTSIIEDGAFDELRYGSDINDFRYSTSIWKHDKGVAGYTIEMSEKQQEFEEYHEGPSSLDRDIDDLRKCLHTLFEEMTDNEWRGVMEIFMDLKKAAAKSLDLEQSDNWRHIVSGTYEFDEAEQHLIALTKLKVADVRKWMAYLTTCGNNLQKLGIQVINDGSAKDLRNTTSARKYRLVSSPVTSLKFKSPGQRCLTFNSISTFKRILKVLPVPKKR